MDLELKGKRAIVTGGSKGIGRAVAEILAREGCHVALCARNADGVKAAVAALSATGVMVTGAAVDVGDGVALKQWIAAAAAELGGLDILVANVSALAVSNEDASWRRAFEVDIMGTVAAVDGALPLLEQSAAGAIVVISSVSGVEIDFAAGPYGAMKAALLNYVAALSTRLAPKHIRVNAVSPGNTYFPGGVWQQIEQGMPDLFKASMALNPMGRMARPEEIGKAVAFLASPASSFTTGTNLVVDGALTKRVHF